MLLVQAHLALVELTHPALHKLELGLCDVGSAGRLLDAGAQPGHALVDGFHPGASGLDLTGQPGQALAPVGLGPNGGQVGPFGLGRSALLGRQLGPGGLQATAGLLQFRDETLFPRGDLVRLSLQSVRIGAGAAHRFGVQVLGPFRGDPDGGADPFGQGGEPEPGLLGGVGALGERGHRRLAGAELLAGHREPRGGLLVLAAQRGLDIVGTDVLRAAGRQVVGGQPEPGIAQVRLNRLGAPGHLGLPPQRLELTAQLSGQIGQPGQVGRRGVQLA